LKKRKEKATYSCNDKYFQPGMMHLPVIQILSRRQEHQQFQASETLSQRKGNETAGTENERRFPRSSPLLSPCLVIP
jgi:hypothetical protein